MSDADESCISEDEARRWADRAGKAFTLLAFRNGPVEDMHAGIECPCCRGKSEYSQLSQDDMKTLNKFMVNRVATLLFMFFCHPDLFDSAIQYAGMFGGAWDDAEIELEEWRKLHAVFAHKDL